MYEFSRILGKLVRKSRTQMGLTQMDVSSALEMDNRTILNIENYRGNPKLCVLYPLFRYLKIDANALFYPESQDDAPTITQLRILLSDCTEEEAELLHLSYVVVEAALFLEENYDAFCDETWYIYTDEKIFCTSKISELEKELNDSSVVRVHKSYMVNIEYMSLKNGRILMQDWKVELPIGRSYKENVKRAYHEYGIKMARRRI
ncbi:MAG: hypothetical protein EGR89_04735 [[Eubacterium] rectale]|nr:hypothetical protein [Agathobacter rectalis]